MKYWGIDIGKDITACVARDETGAVVQTESVRDLRSVCNLIQEDDRVAVEWTGGRGRMLLEMLWERGVRQTYIYKGWLKADRLHLGYQRKGDVPDASTIAYALYATFTPGVPFREGALTEYAQMRNIYALRLEASRIDSLTRLKVQLQNLSHSLKASKAEAKMDAVIDVQEKEITASYALFRRACLHCQPVVEVLKVLREIFNGSDRAIYMLAVQIAPLERFRTADALKRYCGLLQQFPESGGRATSPVKWRGGNRRARVAMFQLLQAQIAIGNGHGKRGRWRDYYDRLRERMGHGEAMIRMMKRLCDIIYRTWASGRSQEVLLIGEASLRRQSRKQQIQEQVLSLIETGSTDYEAAKHIGIDPSTISAWKRRDRAFLERYIQARLKAKEATQNDSE